MEKCIVISTYSNDLEVINCIQKELLEGHLAAGCQVSSVDSTYWWNNRIYSSKEYCLQVRTVISLYDKIESIIKDIHNYELPEISYYEINGSKEIINWINENSKC